MRLSVPYISQLVGGSGGNNCGPACLAMALAHRGVIAPTQDAMLEVADIARDGLSDDRGTTGGYTTLHQLAQVAGWYGQSTWAPRSWADVGASVERQEPVIVLLNNRVLQPRQYPNTSAWAAMHFVLITSTAEGPNRFSSDPLSYYVGGPSFYTEAATRQGVADTQGFNALALTPLPEVLPPAPPTPEEVASMSDWQLINFVLQPLYEWAGLADEFNPKAGLTKTWVAALRAGVYAGRPRTGERHYGSEDGKNPDEGVWAEFDHRVLIYKHDGTMSWNG